MSIQRFSKIDCKNIQKYIKNWLYPRFVSDKRMWTYIFVKYICIVLHIICQQVGLSAHHQDVVDPHGVQRPCTHSADLLVDAQEADVRINGNLTGPPTSGSACVGVVHKDLRIGNITRKTNCLHNG